MTASEHLALLIAAAVHDLGHMGVNNAFLVSTGMSMGGREGGRERQERERL